MTIKKSQPDKGKHIKVDAEKDKPYQNIHHPVFCFKHLHTKYNLSKCTDKEKKCLIEQIALISQKTWDELVLTQRHGIGCEKIEIKSLKANIPVSFTDDVKHLLAFRFDGKKPFVGFRNGFIFHVFFIDRDFTLYNH